MEDVLRTFLLHRGVLRPLDDLILTELEIDLLSNFALFSCLAPPYHSVQLPHLNNPFAS